MATTTSMIVAAAKRARGYSDKLLQDIRPEQFARKPVLGGKVIDTNHPAFVYGHLALYPARLMRTIGLDGEAVAAPAAWTDILKAGTPCHDDPEGKIYPPMREITAAYARGYDAAIAAVEKLDDAVLSNPTPDERFRETFPVVGGALIMLLCNHIGMHMGQVSAWRRCMGLGSVM